MTQLKSALFCDLPMPDLSGAHLYDVDLSGAHLYDADFREVPDPRGFSIEESAPGPCIKTVIKEAL